MDLPIPRETGLAPPTPLPANLSPATITHLANELAMNIRDPEEIYPRYGLNEGQFQRLQRTDFFRRALEASTIEWNSPTNSKKRIEIESAVSLEATLPVVTSQAMSPVTPLKDKVDACKMLASLCGASRDTRDRPTDTEKFIINIDFGGANKVNVVKDVTPRQEMIDVEPAG